MRLLHVLFASGTLAAVLQGRQDSAATTSLTRTRSEQSAQSTPAATTTGSLSSSTTPSNTPAATDPASDYGSYDGPGDSSSGSSGSAVDTDAGASGGTSGSFNLSKGGIIAICVVVSLVVVFGIATTVLFILAKRRQWNVRASIRRASRRFTGRGGGPPARSDRQSKRAGLQMTSAPATRGHKRGLVVEVRDGQRGNGEKRNAEGTTGGWQNFSRNDGRR